MNYKKIYLAVALSLIAAVGMADEKRNIALLASSCAACHGTHGKSVGATPSLAGLSKPYFIEKMQAFKRDNKSSSVMSYHAKGYTDDEIKLLAGFFAAQK